MVKQYNNLKRKKLSYPSVFKKNRDERYASFGNNKSVATGFQTHVHLTLPLGFNSAEVINSEFSYRTLLPLLYSRGIMHFVSEVRSNFCSIIIPSKGEVSQITLRL